MINNILLLVFLEKLCLFLGLQLVTGSYDSTVCVWDVDNRVQKVKLQVHLLILIVINKDRKFFFRS